MNLNLEKDLCVFDLETTGLDISSDRIVEISILKITPNGEEEELSLRINPTIPISEESTKIHGISDEDVKGEPTFSEVADKIAEFIGNADLAGYNSNKFDIPILAEEFLRIDHSFDVGARKFIDVQNIFHKMEQRTLVAAYKFYCDKELINAHSASADVLATYEVFKAQLQRYKELENNMDFLADFSTNNKNEIVDFAGRLAKNDQGKIIYNFGKHKGKTIEEINQSESGYAGWMLNGNFPLYTKKVLREEINRIKTKEKEQKQIREQKKGKEMESKLEALKSKFSK